jgi:hypothetical protein
VHDRHPSRDHLTNARPAPRQYKRQEKQSCKLSVFRGARVAKPANGKDLKSPQILASLSFRIVPCLQMAKPYLVWLMRISGGSLAEPCGALRSDETARVPAKVPTVFVS